MFHIEYNPETNTLTTAFAKDNYSGEAMVKSAQERMQELHSLIANNAAGRLLLITGPASLGVTQVITSYLKPLVSAIAVCDLQIPPPEGMTNVQMFIVTVSVNPRHKIGDLVPVAIPATVEAPDM